MLVAMSEGRKTDWQCAPSVELTTQLLRETADYIFKLGEGNIEALEVRKNVHLFFCLLYISKQAIFQGFPGHFAITW